MGTRGLLEGETVHSNGVLCLFTDTFCQICSIHHEDYDYSPFLSSRLQGSGACFGSLGLGWIDSAFEAIEGSVVVWRTLFYRILSLRYRSRLMKERKKSSF